MCGVQAAQRAIHDGVAVSTSFLFNSDNDVQQQMHVDVLPITGTTSSASSRSFLVFLQEGATASPHGNAMLSAVSLAHVPEDQRDTLIAQQEQDLSATRFHLQSLIQERDGRNQELVSANEEIQAANEELQSTNEELGTTKEELQSANEELQTVNDELQQRNTILLQTGNDLSNLLTSVNIPLLMLTSDLRIRQFTPPMQRLLSVRPTDIGRPISEIRFHLSVENLEDVLREVLETLSTREIEVQDAEHRWYLLRIRPYRTAEDKIEGLVLILMDIDQLRSSQQEMLDARDFARSVVECVPLSLVVVRQDLTIQTANTAFRAMAGLRSQELEGRSFPDLVEHLWGLGLIQSSLERIFGLGTGEQFEFEHGSPTEDRKTLLVKGQALQFDGHKVALIVMDDITIRRQAEILLNLQNSELESAIATAAVTLDRTQEELRSLTAHLFRVQEEERQKIARELHDDISQRLTYLDFLLRDMPASQDQPERQAKLTEARAQLQTLNTDVRLISHHLHPAVLEELGLSAALKVLVDEFGEREGMPATYISRDVPVVQSQPAATALYRITQEALRNVAKHAGKTHVKVILEGEGQRLRLQVIDLGLGFDQDDMQSIQGLGLISMKERAHMAHGTLTLNAALGLGTTVTAEIPFDFQA